MKKLFVFLLSLVCVLCFSFSVQAEERRQPTIEELKQWPYKFYSEMKLGYTGEGIDYGLRYGVGYIFSPPEDHYLKAILVVVAKGYGNKIYAVALGCQYRDPKKQDKIACEFKEHLQQGELLAEMLK